MITLIELQIIFFLCIFVKVDTVALINPNEDVTKQHPMKVVVTLGSDLRHAEVRWVGAPVGPQAVLQGHLLALQGVHQIPELGGRPHAPGSAGAPHHRVAVVATELQVVCGQRRGAEV